MNSNQTPDAKNVEKDVEALVRKSGSSFYWAMWVLPRHKRMAMYAIYAFCRGVDDIADGSGREADKMKQLDFWRQELDRLYHGIPSEPVCLALAQPVLDYGLEQKDFLSVIEGMERDARPQVRITDEQDLAIYCDAVACSVGRLANCVFGIDRETGNAIADSLGQALQLTNILRDVAEDAACDRMYIPQTLLDRHGVKSDDPMDALTQSGFSVACRELAGLAVDHYEAADLMLRRHDRSVMRPAVLMMQTYRSILRRLQKRGWNDNDQRVRLSSTEKFMIMLRYGFFSI